MKICYITNLISIHSQRWIEPVIAAGHEVYIINFVDVADSINGAIETINLTKISNIPKFRFLIWSYWLRKYLGRLNPDILHAHQLSGAGWIGALTNYHPFLITAWGSDILIEPDINAFRAALTKYVLKNADQITVPSTLMLSKVVELGYPEQKVHLIPWGLETDIFTYKRDDRIETRLELNISAEAPVLFCPRRIVQIQNIDIVVTTLIELVDKYPEIRLVLIEFRPDNKYLEYINQLIDQYQLKENIIWLHPQSSQYTMARLYRMADVVLSTPSSEGYGFSVYEAMACGVPTIISDLPVYEDEIKDQIHTIKVPVRDVDATRQAIQRLLNDNNFTTSIVFNAREIIKNKSILTRTKAVNALYNQLVTFQ